MRVEIAGTVSDVRWGDLTRARQEDRGLNCIAAEVERAQKTYL